MTAIFVNLVLRVKQYINFILFYKMSAICICFMDRDYWTARTDVIVIVSLEENKLMWVPRDIYCELINDRINVAYALGGSELLIKCLNEYKVTSKYNILGCVCLLPALVNEYVKYIKSIKVPVENDIKFDYPLRRNKPIEEGSKVIEFKAPFEILSGERIHQWIGARYCIPLSLYLYPDLHRIMRQQILTRVLIDKKFDFGFILDNPEINDFIQGINSSIIENLKKLNNIQIEPINIDDYKSLYINESSCLQNKLV
jgi:hypothetical protein